MFPICLAIHMFCNHQKLKSIPKGTLCILSQTRKWLTPSLYMGS
eukprot:UN17069